MQNPFESFNVLMQPMQNAWTQMVQQWGGQWMPNQAPHSGVMPESWQTMLSTFGQLAPGTQVQFDPKQLWEVQQEYFQEIMSLWQQGLTPPASIAEDRRFAGEAWQKQPISGFAAALHLIHTRLLMRLVDAMQTDAKTQARVRFAVEQWAAAAAPSNFLAFNPEAQQIAIDSHGESIAKGVQNMLHDIQQGHLSMTDESQFEVGRNVASTEGAVVFENEIFQLIEYKPITEKVYEMPMVLVPPCINKFYIMDLQPDNSLARFVAEQGHRTFMVSWRNPGPEMAKVTWDDYVQQGVITALETVSKLTNKPQVNALGFCVGGTLLCCALSVLAARNQSLVNSATFLTTLIDFTNTGVLDLFVDENFVRMREMQFGNGGLLPSKDLSTTFSFLRPNDLVWNYVVGNYLKGETPPAFDLLYWNCDSTSMPGPMYAWYMRNTYLENRLVEPGRAVVCGEPVDLNKIKLPMYIYGSREDHIVPIEGAYASTQQFPDSDKRFVMGASGHIAGVINPLKKNKRCYWTNDAQPASYEEWFAGAQEHAGSWWADWRDWLSQHAGKQLAAPKRYSAKMIEPAPGRYVKQRALA